MAAALRKFATHQGLSLSSSYPAYTHTLHHNATSGYNQSYAATEVVDDNNEDEDEEMTDVGTESISNQSTPDTSLEEAPLQKRQAGLLVRDEAHVIPTGEENVPKRDDGGGRNGQGGDADSLLEEGSAQEPGEDVDDPLLSKAATSEWDGLGGLKSIELAFEGTMLLEAGLDDVVAWCAPVVWRLFLRQASYCSAAASHPLPLSMDAAMPSFLPKLLTRAMPRYKGEMTRSIAITHALLYLHKCKTCFHCTGANAALQRLADQPVQQSSMMGAAGMPAPYMDDERRRALLLEAGSQASLFFAVGMHYASLWLLDCCPSEKAYWKRYVHCVPTARGVAWSRLVLQHWNYRISVSLDEWLSFSSQLVGKFPLVDEEDRQRRLFNNSAAATTLIMA